MKSLFSGYTDAQIIIDVFLIDYLHIFSIVQRERIKFVSLCLSQAQSIKLFDNNCDGCSCERSAGWPGGAARRQQWRSRNSLLIFLAWLLTQSFVAETIILSLETINVQLSYS